MGKKKGGHSTPPDLDYLFRREIIDEEDYTEFWEGYWDETRSRDKERYVDEFISSLQMELPIKERPSGTVTKSIKRAREQAKEIGGIVIRRTKDGRFSKRGRYYQAIARRKRK